MMPGGKPGGKHKYAFPILPGKKADLGKIDPGYDAGISKEESHTEFMRLNSELHSLQEELYAARADAVLVILQGPDTSGKDGAVRHVFDHVNPQGCRVESFKIPTEEEMEHDFLWRIHHVTPARGMITVFNRSHYEDVLVVRVHKIVPRKVWESRFQQINEFERLLTSNSTMVFKFFLHISKDEQEKRLRAREQDIDKAWKLNPGDWKERELWDEYQNAYEDALTNCSTKDAAWHVIPADKKWFRDLAISEVLVNHLGKRRDVWKKTLRKLSEERRKELDAVR